MRMQEEQLEKILGEIPLVRVGVIGDACVDIYWRADMTKSELSREVPHHTLPVYEERVSLGAGSNVVNNLVAMGAESVQFVSCIGTDWRARLVKEQLDKICVSDRRLVVSDRLVTPAYCKPIRCGISNVCYEAPRIDFENLMPIPKEVGERLRENFRDMADKVDILLVSDQFTNGCVTPEIIEDIGLMGESKTVVVDSRSRIAKYRGAVLKPNEVEACRCLNIDLRLSRDVGFMEEAAARLLNMTRSRMVLLTLGERGAVCCGPSGSQLIPACPVEPPIDFVGAGDAFLAAFALAYAITGCGGCAAEFASLASAVVIKKLGTTGSAAPDEIRRAYRQYFGRGGTLEKEA